MRMKSLLLTAVLATAFLCFGGVANAQAADVNSATLLEETLTNSSCLGRASLSFPIHVDPGTTFVIGHLQVQGFGLYQPTLSNGEPIHTELINGRAWYFYFPVNVSSGAGEDITIDFLYKEGNVCAWAVQVFGLSSPAGQLDLIATSSQTAYQNPVITENPSGSVNNFYFWDVFNKNGIEPTSLVNDNALPIGQGTEALLNYDGRNVSWQRSFYADQDSVQNFTVPNLVGVTMNWDFENYLYHWSFNVQLADINPTLSDFGQFEFYGTPIASAASTTENTIMFQGTPNSPVGNQVQLQIELQLSSAAFTDVPNATSSFVPSGRLISIIKSDLAIGQYHWQARAVDSQGNASVWQTMSSPAANIDFAIIPYPLAPYPYGFQFANYGIDTSTIPVSDLVDRHYVFDRAFDFSSLPNKYHQFLYNTAYRYYTDDLGGGDCYGFSLISAYAYQSPDYFENNFSPFAAELSEVNGLPWNLAAPTLTSAGYYYAGAIESRPVLAAIMSIQLQQFGDASQKAIKNSPKKYQDILSELNTNLSAKTPNTPGTQLYLLNIISKAESRAHTVLPYRVEGNKIYIYDPNDPAASSGREGSAFNAYVSIDSDKSATLHSSGTEMIISSLRIESVKDLYNGGKLPGLNLSKVFVVGGKLLLKDTWDNMSGFFNGQVYDQIFGLLPILPAKDDSGAGQFIPTGYMIDTDVPLEMIVQGDGSGLFNLTSVRENYLVNVSGITSGPGSTDTFNFTSSSVQAVISAVDAGRPFSVFLDNIGDGQDHVFTATTTPEANATYTYSVDWNALDQGQNGVTLKIDFDDGTPSHTVEVGASFADDTAPVTTPAVTGTLGQNSWYISDAQVSLSAIDNLGGVGVEATKYSIDNGSWQTYDAQSPINISAEGTHSLQYFSTDYFGNEEAIATLLINIDKTAPEAKIAVDLITRAIAVEGVDQIAKTTVTKDSQGNYVITDEAGHMTKLGFRKAFGSDNKNLFFQEINPLASPVISWDAQGNCKFNDEDGHSSRFIYEKKSKSDQTTYAQLISIQYDGGPVIKLPIAHFFYVWNKQSEVLSSQTVYVNKSFFVQAFYDSQANQTTTYLKQKGSAMSIKKFPGLEIIQILTNKGVLGYQL
ncbi:MAG: hypothetical protein PHE24_04180 [Patescibacteria group bacterium]|nr:hypothetical protein [Patescibacteria group bacterium]